MRGAGAMREARRSPPKWYPVRLADVPSGFLVLLSGQRDLPRGWYWVSYHRDLCGDALVHRVIKPLGRHLGHPTFAPHSLTVLDGHEWSRRAVAPAGAAVVDPLAAR